MMRIIIRRYYKYNRINLSPAIQTAAVRAMNFPHHQVWHVCMERLRDRIPAADMNTWVAPLQPVRNENTLKLLAPNRYVLNYVKSNLFRQIEETVLQTNNGIRRVRVEIGGHGSHNGAPSPKISPHKTAVKIPYAGGAMDPNYTFARHIEGRSNQLARAAAQQVGGFSRPADAYNPLFIYGDVGLGKTHLMQAAGHLMLQTNPRRRVVFVRAELFVNDMVDALKNNRMSDFKKYYRSQEALLIDDIQFFARKTQSQEEFFHTFNTLFEGKQQIIMTSDRIPMSINDIDARLISRFSGGLTVQIEPPELETRVAILEKKALEREIELPHAVAFFIANAIRANIRELEGALHSVLATANFSGRGITVELAREALRDRLAHQDRQTSVDNIQQTVAEYYKIRVSDLLAKSRARNIARPRQFAMYFSQEYTNLSLPQIGDRFGGRDHTTVLHAGRKIKELIQTDAKIKEDYRNLQRLLGV